VIWTIEPLHLNPAGIEPKIDGGNVRNTEEEMAAQQTGSKVGQRGVDTVGCVSRVVLARKRLFL
jgi:hypothetical protein